MDEMRLTQVGLRPLLPEDAVSEAGGHRGHPLRTDTGLIRLAEFGCRIAQNAATTKAVPAMSLKGFIIPVRPLRKGLLSDLVYGPRMLTHQTHSTRSGKEPMSAVIISFPFKASTDTDQQRWIPAPRSRQATERNLIGWLRLAGILGAALSCWVVIIAAARLVVHLI